MSCDGNATSWENESGGGGTEPAPDSLFVALQAVIVVVWLIGIPGNALSIVAVLRYKKLRTAGNIFVTNVSIADGLYYTVSLPIRFYTFHVGCWAFSDEFCSFFGGLSHFLNGAAVLFLAAIALNRLLFIQHSKRYHTLYSRSGLTLQIASIWMVTLIITIVLPGSGLWGGYAYQSTVRSCTLRPYEDTVFKLVIITVGFWIPAGFIVVCYGLIFKHYKASQKRVSNWVQRASQHGGSKDGARGSVTSDSAAAAAAKTVTSPIVRQPAKPLSAIAEAPERHQPSTTVNHTLSIKTITKQETIKISSITDDFYSDDVFNHGTVSVYKRRAQTPKIRKESASDPGAWLLKSSMSLSSDSEDFVPADNALTSLDAASVCINASSRAVTAPPPQQQCDVSAADAANRRVAFDNNAADAAKPTTQAPILVTTTTTNRVRKQSVVSSVSNKSTASKRRVKFVLTVRQQREAIVLTAMMVCIFVLFSVSILPYFVVIFIYPDFENPEAYLMALMCTWFNGCINPVIYALMNIQYRNAFRSLLKPPCQYSDGYCRYHCCCYCECQRVSPDVSNVQLQQSATHM